MVRECSLPDPRLYHFLVIRVQDKAAFLDGQHTTLECVARGGYLVRNRRLGDLISKPDTLNTNEAILNDFTVYPAKNKTSSLTHCSSITSLLSQYI